MKSILLEKTVCVFYINVFGEIIPTKLIYLLLISNLISPGNSTKFLLVTNNSQKLA